MRMRPWPTAPRRRPGAARRPHAAARGWPRRGQDALPWKQLLDAVSDRPELLKLMNPHGYTAPEDHLLQHMETLPRDEHGKVAFDDFHHHFHAKLRRPRHAACAGGDGEAAKWNSSTRHSKAQPGDADDADAEAQASLALLRRIRLLCCCVGGQPAPPSRPDEVRV